MSENLIIAVDLYMFVNLSQYTKGFIHWVDKVFTVCSLNMLWELMWITCSKSYFSNPISDANCFLIFKDCELINLIFLFLTIDFNILPNVVNRLSSGSGLWLAAVAKCYSTFSRLNDLYDFAIH